ncbi:MAG: spherulation-specific family 4 protein [Planctomycetaceae bacterium]
MTPFSTSGTRSLFTTLDFAALTDIGWVLSPPASEDDYGDAPSAAQSGFASSYPVTLAEDGARHTSGGPSLGTSRDSEADGIHSAGADADDTIGAPDDEDGVTFTTSILASTNASRIGSVNVDLQNADGTSNRLDAWIDFNRDGDWDDPGEQILTNYNLGTTNGSQSVSFPIPQDAGANVQEGTTFARFRLSTAGSLSVTGAAADGEVEDHAVTIGPSTDAILWEPFDHSAQFTVSEPYFSIGDGSAFFGISDGAGGGDFGPGSPPTPTVPAYTGATGNFLTGMDMDATATGHPAASLPIVATWTGLNISGQSGLQFGADFASFDEGLGGDPGGRIEPTDFIRVEVQIDGGGFVNIMEFRGNNTGGANAAYFSLDTDGDGSGDGTLLTDALRNFTADIVGSGSLLDLRISMSVSDQDEDFAIDNVTVTANNPTGPFVVDTIVDESDGDYSAGDFSLREAIERANTHVGIDEIQFAAGLSGQTITLTIDQLAVTDDLIITGLGASNLTVSGGDSFRVFDLQHDADVVVEGLTITGGRTTQTGGTPAGITGGGAGIRSSGTLLLSNSIVTDNHTTAAIADGGGIFQVSGTLTLDHSTVSNNSTSGTDARGGGISAYQSDAIITNSVIDGNSTASANGVGGGIFVFLGDLLLTDSTVSNNENTGAGALGGGVVVAGNMIVTGSTISGNMTPGPGGGVMFDSGGAGAIATIVNSTVSGNTAAIGGGIANYRGTLNLEHSTVTANTAGAASGSGLASFSDGTSIADTVVLSSIIADNVNSDVDNILSGSGTNTVTSSGFNLVGTGNAIASFGAGSDLTGISPVLGPLANNGGPTFTHALLAGSPAINAGPASTSVAFDQRGLTRVAGASADVGAFELQDTNPSVTLSVDNPEIPEGGLFSSVNLLVPAYANPASPDGPAFWDGLIAAAASGANEVHVILNPASGPGASPIDPNYVNDTGSGAFGPVIDLKAVGGIVYGYVPTGFGSRSLVSVLADIDTYYDPTYWRGSGVQIDGIFFDEMSNDLADVGYYQTLRDHVRSKTGTKTVIGNPGTTFTTDSSGGSSGFTVNDYANTADILVTFENTGNEYRNNYTPPSWLNDFSDDHFAHVIHSESSVTEALRDISLAGDRKAGLLFITSDTFPNPYDEVSSYWSSNATFTATLAEISGADVIVDLGLTGTATGGGTDYAATGTQIVIPAGSLNGSVTVMAVQDGIDDDAETVIVDIVGVSNGTENGTQQQTTIIIDDDDPVPSDTVVGLDGSNDLLIQDINGGDTNDTITLSINGTSIRVHDPNNVLSAGTGATAVDANTVEIPIDALTGSGGIIVDTLGGDDTLTIDFTGGNFSEAISYQGGSQTTSPNGDVLILTGGGPFADVAFGFVNNNDGSVEITGNAMITYTGLEPITANVNATNVVLNYSGTAEDITIINAGGGQTSVDSTAGEIVTFNNPSGSITINAGGGNDNITVTSLDPAFAGYLFLDGQGNDDRIIVDVDPDANIRLNAETVDLNAPMTGTVSGNAATVNIAATASIQDGIDAAAPGGTVLISPGTYNEAVTIDRMLTVQGTTTTLGDVIINPTTGVDAIHVDNNAADVTIRNLQLGGNTVNPIADGLRVVSATGTLTVDNVSIQRAAGSGIHVIDADAIVVDSTIVNRSGADGFSVPDGGGSLQITILNSTFTNNVDDGIEIYNTDDVVLTGLTVEDNLDVGINVVGGSIPGYFRFGEAAALTHLAGGDLLFADRDNNFGILTTDGIGSLRGFLDHDSKGLAFDGSSLLSVSPRDALLRTLDQTDGATLSSVAISLTGETVLGATGLAVNPVDGVVYALLRLQGRFARELVTLNSATGVATSIGNTGDGFAALAFTDSGNLYGVTGDGGNVRETLFELNTATAAATPVLELGSGDDGESLAFNPTDGLFYHFSGLSDLVYESINPTTLATQDISLSTDIGPGPDVTITNSSILRNFSGIETAFVVDITLTNTTMQNNQHGMSVSTAGSLTIDGGSYSSSVSTNIFVDEISDRVSLTNVTVDNSAEATGIQIIGALGVSITGGSVSGNDALGLLVDGFPTGVTLDGVTVDNNGNSGFNLFNAASVTITGGSFSNNAGHGISLESVTDIVTTDVVVTGNAVGMEVLYAQSLTDTDGTYSGNDDDGIRLTDIYRDVTLNRTVLEDNDADNNQIGDGLHAVFDEFFNSDAIGGDFVVRGATIGTSNPGTTHQRNGVFVNRVGGTVTFEDSVGPNKEVRITGNDDDAVEIISGTSAVFTNGLYSNNVEDGLDLLTFTGTIVITNVTADGNGQAGVQVEQSGAVNIEGGTINNNLLGLDILSIGLLSLTDVVSTGNTQNSLIDLVPTVNIDTAIGTTSDDLQLNTPGVGGEGFLQFTRAGVPQNVVNFTNVGTLDVDLNAGNDTVTVAPHSTTIFDLDGGSPTVAPGDTLTYLADGTSPFNFGASTISTTGKATILYTDFETTSVVGNAVNLSISAAAGTEADQTVITVTATANGNVLGDQTVDLAVTGAGITAGDYALSSATITIPDGMTTGSVTFTVQDDVIVEGTETAVLTISNPSAGIVLGASDSRSVVITDNDTQNLVVTPTSVNVNEGGTQTFDVKLSAQPAGDVTVTVSHQSGDADISVTGGATLTFTPSNWNTAQPVTLSAAEDADADNGSATIRVSSGGLANVDVTASEVDNDGGNPIAVGVSAVSNGSESGPVSGQFLVSLSAVAQQDVEVSYTLGGTALAGEDYSGAATGTVTIMAGTLSVPLNIPVIDDRVAEGGADHLSVQLDSVTASGNVSIDTGADTASVLLFDNDFAGIILSKSQVTVSEDATTATFDVVLTSKPTGNVILNVASSDTGEAAVTDGATLTFTPDNWDTPQPVTVTGVDDGDVDGTQSSIISVSVAGETTAGEYTSVPAAKLTAKTDDNDATAAATVESITFFNNDADVERQLSVDETGQRSIIRQVEVVVNGEIDVVDASAFALQHLGTGNAVNVTLTSSIKAGGRTTILLAFSGTHVDVGGFVGLENGNYELTIDGDALGVTGGEQKMRFHRLYGDSDGDRDVDGADYGNFISALYFGSAGYNSVFDIDDSSTLFDDLDNFFGAFGSVLLP